MKIAVIGCGAMGSVYAARLGSAGNEVLVVDRGEERVRAINTSGLLLDGPDGQHRAFIRATTAAPADKMELVILSVKAADVAVAARQALQLIGTDTVVLTIQNGLGSAAVAAAIVGAERLAVGIASGFGAAIKGPGHAHHNAMQAVRMGAHKGLPFEMVERIAAVWHGAGFDASAVNDIEAMQWEKLICNVAYSAPCALSGLTVGEVMDDPHMGPISRAAAVEAWMVAEASGIEINVRDPVAHVRAFGARMPAAKPSALQDFEARRVTEIDVINGAIPAQGRKVGIQAPVNTTLVGLIKAAEQHWSRR